MLKQRVLTALVLLLILLPALFASSIWPFVALMGVMVTAAGWEWGRLNGLGPAAAIGFGAVVAAGVGAMFAMQWVGQVVPLAWWAAMAAWVLLGAYVLATGVSRWPVRSQAVRLLAGAVMLWLVWLAMAQARVQGINFLLSVFCLVWAADVAAYFGGRALGRRKLAPAISPGKSWEGVWSGMLGVALLAAAWIAFDARGAGTSDASLYSHLLARLGWFGLLVCLAFLAAMSVVGDLVESLVKRSSGSKDSSGLLPGHGGVLDRVDALLPVFPLAMALCSL